MQQLNILFFGQLAELAGSSNVLLEAVQDTEELEQKLHQRFPALAHTKYRIAVDKQLVTGNRPLSAESTVALLPPFSGG